MIDAMLERRRHRESLKRVAATFGVLLVAYRLYLRSDFHRRGNRLFYRRGRPNRIGRAANRIAAILFGAGIGPSFLVALETTGHHSGKRRVIPVVICDYGGERYLVSMLGEGSPWVRNVRAANGKAIIRHGRRRDVHLVEVAAEERAPIIKAYLARAFDARPHYPLKPDAPIEEFERIAGSYPVFRID